MAVSSGCVRPCISAPILGGKELAIKNKVDRRHKMSIRIKNKEANEHEVRAETNVRPIAELQVLPDGRGSSTQLIGEQLSTLGYFDPDELLGNRYA